MADYSKFKNVNGDDLVLQDSRVDAISEKVEGIEAGAEVNKIESISINDTELAPKNKNVNIKLGNGLNYDDDELFVTMGTAGIVYDYDGEYVTIEGFADADFDTVPVKTDLGRDFYGLEWKPLPQGDNITIENDNSNKLSVKYNNNTIVENGNGLEVAVPVPDPDIYQASDGDVLTYNATSDEIVWAAPTTLHVDDDTIKNTNGTLSVNYGTGLTVYGYAGENKLCVANPVPTFTTADAGKVLTINAAGNGLEWTLPNVPANAVSLNNEPVGVNGDYFTVGEGQ